MHAYDAQNVTFHLISTDTPLHYHTPNISLCVELHFNICDCHPSAKEGEWDDSSPINLNLEMFAKTASCSCSCHKLLAQDFLQNLPALWNCLLTKFILKSPSNPAIPVNITHMCVCYNKDTAILDYLPQPWARSWNSMLLSIKVLEPKVAINLSLTAETNGGLATQKFCHINQ